MEIFPVIMVGGAGTRLWPVSRRNAPKQLMKVGSEESFLRASFRRASKIAPVENVLVVTTAVQREMVLGELPDVPPENVIAEPEGRDTAAAVGLAAIVIYHRSPRGVCLMLPADHHIGSSDEFARGTRAAARVAADHDYLVTTGVVPTYASTAYGYIHRGEKIGEVDGIPAYRVNSFREKPNPYTAKEYLESGEYYWNAGIFAWKAQVVLEEFARYLPEHYIRLQEIADATDTADFDQTLERVYPELPRISVDYGIMEYTRRAAVVECVFSWDDVGSWTSVGRYYPKDERGNAAEGEVLLLDCRDNVVRVPEGKLVAMVGVQDMVVIDTEDALFIAPKERDQEVKEIVKRLAAEGREGIL